MSGLVTIGESLGLVISRGIGGFGLGSAAEVSFGGAESNVAIGAARLGCESTWIGRLGADPMGNRILRTLRGEGVRTVCTIDDVAPTALMLKDRPHLGATSVHYYRAGSAGSRIAAADVPDDILKTASVLHVTGISLAIGDEAAATTMDAVRRAKANGAIISFDINHRTRLWSIERAAASYLELITLADVVFAGADEASIVVGEGTPAEQLRAIQGLGPAQVIVKLGADGAIGVGGNELIEQAAFAVPVADTVGAGDAFVAGYLVEVIAGADLATSMRTASAAGAFACRSDGDWEGLPTRRDIAALVSDGDPVRR